MSFKFLTAEWGSPGLPDKITCVVGTDVPATLRRIKKDPVEISRSDVIDNDYNAIVIGAIKGSPWLAYIWDFKQGYRFWDRRCAKFCDRKPKAVDDRFFFGEPMDTHTLDDALSHILASHTKPIFNSDTPAGGVTGECLLDGMVVPYDGTTFPPTRYNYEVEAKDNEEFRKIMRTMQGNKVLDVVNNEGSYVITLYNPSLHFMNRLLDMGAVLWKDDVRVVKYLPVEGAPAAG